MQQWDVAKEIVELKQQEQTLVTRLDKGLALIFDRQERGEDVDKHEALWLALLSDYEATHDRLEALERGEAHDGD